ncbi:MAG: hypothetical protein ABI193_24725 [Minicystis sp.]
MSITARRALLAELARDLRSPLITLILYLLLRALLAVTSGHGGIFTPNGHVNPLLIVLTLSVIVLRLLVLFFVPGLIVYRLIARLIAHAHA